jgi:hypothetical protein
LVFNIEERRKYSAVTLRVFTLRSLRELFQPPTDKKFLAYSFFKSNTFVQNFLTLERRQNWRLYILTIGAFCLLPLTDYRQPAYRLPITLITDHRSPITDYPKGFGRRRPPCQLPLANCQLLKNFAILRKNPIFIPSIVIT